MRWVSTQINPFSRRVLTFNFPSLLLKRQLAGSRKPDTLRLQIGRLCHLLSPSWLFVSIVTHFTENLKFSSFHASHQNNAHLMSMSITHIQLYTTFHHSFSWYSWFHKYSLNIFHFIYFSSILFADIVGFTNLSSQCSAQVKISLFDNIFWGQFVKP